MLRSKSRSGAFDFGANNNSSILSRTLSSSRICRGDPLIQRDALVSIQTRPSAKIISSSQNQIVRVSTMQRQMGRLEEELQSTKDQLDAAGADRDRALDQLAESKMVANEANIRLNEALTPRRAGKVFAELTTVKESLSNSQKELAVKEKSIESMKLEQAKKLENKLAKQDSSLGRLNKELRNAKVSETRALNLCSESKKRVEELEAELQKEKQSDCKMLESVVSKKTEELEATKIELEESKLQIASLREQMSKLKNSSAVSSSRHSNIESTESLKSKAADQHTEIDVLKRELKAAIEGEEKSTKAMNDLALALKEVATQGNQTKEKLTSTEMALEHLKEEAEQLKGMVRTMEERYQKLLDEAKKETELHKNTADRLRVEAEESYLAWNGKEMGFVGVIKKVEEEKTHTQRENTKLTESLKAAEHTSRTAKEENHKLRDILKQALNEANVAKEAATIAREENSQLKDSLADKEEALLFLTRENERLRISEAAANEKMKELKRLLSQAYSELKTEDKEECGTAFMSPESVFDDHKEDNNKLDTAIKKGFSFDLHEIKIHNRYDDNEDDMLVDEDPVKAEALKGSIFDPSTETPRSEPHTPKPPPGHHHQRKSSFADSETVNSEDLDHLDNSHHSDGSHHDSDGHSEDSEGDRHAHKRRKSLLLKSFGYLLMRKSFSHTSHTKKEPTTPTPSPAPSPSPSPVPAPTASPDRQ